MNQSVQITGNRRSRPPRRSTGTPGGRAPNKLLRVSRLRRAKAQLVAELGEVPNRVMYGNALWSIYQALGKLESRVYVLLRPAA